MDFVSDAIRNLCFEYADDLKFYDPDTGQTIVVLKERYFRDLFLRARDLDFCCTHASRLSAKYCLARFEKKIDELGKPADWWKQ